MIRRLREHEEVLLYSHSIALDEEETSLVADYLEEAYRSESWHYPSPVPPYDRAAASWAARLVYISANLLLYRNAKPASLPQLFPSFEGDHRLPGAILSADLTLRFLPDIVSQLKLIDVEDELVQILEETLRQWHYSAIGYDLPIHQLDLAIMVSDPCVRTMYVDRVIQQKVVKLANHPALEEYVRAAMGIHGTAYWKDFTPTVHE